MHNSVLVPILVVDYILADTATKLSNILSTSGVDQIKESKIRILLCEVLERCKYVLDETDHNDVARAVRSLQENFQYILNENNTPLGALYTRVLLAMASIKS